MIAVKGIHGQPVIRAAFPAPEKIVDLVPGDEKPPLWVVLLCGGKVQRLPLQVGKLLQQFLRAVEMEPQKLPVFSVCCDKLLQLIPQVLQLLRMA